MTLQPGRVDEVINGKGVYLSRHAIEAVIERAFTIEEVFETLRSWENRYIQTKRYADGRDPAQVPFMYQRGDMGVAVVETESHILVKTVLLRERSQWTNDQARQRASSRTPL